MQSSSNLSGPSVSPINPTNGALQNLPHHRPILNPKSNTDIKTTSVSSLPTLDPQMLHPLTSARVTPSSSQTGNEHLFLLTQENSNRK